MTHYPDIHTRAAQLVRDSRGRLNLREAYAELARRGHVAQMARRVQEQPKQQVFAWQQRKDLA